MERFSLPRDLPGHRALGHLALNRAERPPSAPAPVAEGASLSRLPARKTVVKCRQSSTLGIRRLPPFPWVYGCGNLGSFCCPHTREGIIAALPARGAASETPLLPASQQLQRGVWGPIRCALESGGCKAGLAGPDSGGGLAWTSRDHAGAIVLGTPGAPPRPESGSLSQCWS